MHQVKTIQDLIDKLSLLNKELLIDYFIVFLKGGYYINKFGDKSFSPERAKAEKALELATLLFPNENNKKIDDYAVDLMRDSIESIVTKIEELKSASR